MSGAVYREGVCVWVESSLKGERTRNVEPEFTPATSRKSKTDKGNHRAERDVCDPACGGKAAGEGWGEGAYKKCAFTIAEVLLTIGILGVIAVMTVPTLMQNSQNKELVSKYLKTNNVLTNAYKEAEAVSTLQLYKQSPDK